jgi:hypothetical protein
MMEMCGTVAQGTEILAEGMNGPPHLEWASPTTALLPS